MALPKNSFDMEVVFETQTFKRPVGLIIDIQM
jgi:hypothetical protein